MKKVLIVVDYQNDFVDGSLGFEKAPKLDNAIAKKIYEYGNGNVFYTLDTHHDDYSETREGKNLPVPHCIKGSHGWGVYGKTATALNDTNAIGFEKNSFGLEITDNVNNMLPKSADLIELVGLVSNICVLSNAVIFQTRYPNAQIIINASLTASFDDELNDKALDVMQGLQIKILNRNQEDK